MTDRIESNWISKIIFFLLCSIVVWTTLLYGGVHQPVIAVFYLMAAMIAILWASDGLLRGGFRFNKNLLQIPLLAAFAYGLFQVIPFGSLASAGGVENLARTISQDPFQTKVAAFHFLALFIFFAAFLAYVDTSKRLRKLVWLIIIFGFLYAFYAILQSFLSPNKIYGIYERQFAQPFGSFVNRHNFAAFMEMTIAVPLGLILAGGVQKDRRLIIITAIGLMAIALLLSSSRGGLVAFLAEVFFLVIITTKTKSYRQFVIKIIISVALIAVVIAGAMMIGNETSLTRIAETSNSKDFTTNRSHIWSVTLDVIKNNLPFGAGLGAFGVAYTPYDSQNGVERVEQAHNDYLQVLADAGLVGLLLGGFFLFWLFRTGLKNIKTENNFRRGAAVGALAGCFAVLVHSVFDFVLHTPAVSLLFLTLVTLVVASGSKTEKNDEEKRLSESHRSRRPASVSSISEKKRVREKSE